MNAVLAFRDLPWVDTLELASRAFDYADWVYAGRCQDTGRVKFGVSSRPAMRVSSISSHSPTVVRLVAARAIGSSRTNVEKAIHAVLAEHHIRNEWFEPCEAVDAMIAVLREGSMPAGRVHPDERAERIERLIRELDAADELRAAREAAVA